MRYSFQNFAIKGCNSAIFSAPTIPLRCEARHLFSSFTSIRIDLNRSGNRFKGCHDFGVDGWVEPLNLTNSPYSLPDSSWTRSLGARSALCVVYEIFGFRPCPPLCDLIFRMTPIVENAAKNAPTTVNISISFISSPPSSLGSAALPISVT